ncbi:hypothetical protein HPK19_25100 (plasmid) [Arthrobacter citreus]|nr:hypothetical protein HPK19_25100 [Arthrobacter citreus]
MIEELDVRCHLSGDKFSPKKVEELTGVKLIQKKEVGEIGTKGPFKEQPVKYGSGVLCPPEGIVYLDYNNKIYWVAKTLYDFIDDIKKCGVEDIDFVIGVFYKEQCNFALEPDALKLIGELGVHLSISCYENE